MRGVFFAVLGWSSSYRRTRAHAQDNLPPPLFAGGNDRAALIRPGGFQAVVETIGDFQGGGGHAVHGPFVNPAN
jgi:hypothetical protein